MSELGSRAHFRETLDRVWATLRAPCDGTAISRSGSDRAEAAAGMPERSGPDLAALMTQLRVSVTAYARRLRADGMPAEQMLVLVKSDLREALPLEARAWEARALIDDLVRWCIDGYYSVG